MNGTEEVVVQETGSRSSEASDEIIAKAKRMGWTDQDEFRGHPDRWVDAQTYVERADEHLPILKGTVAKMDKKMAEQEALILDQNQRIKAMQTDFKEFVGFTRKAEERAYKKALDQLKAEQRQAVEDQDLEKFDRVSADIDVHLQGNPTATKTGTPDAGPAIEGPVFSQATFDSWVGENGWYLDKPKMAVFAQQMDRWVSDTRPQLSQAQRLAEITKLVREEFPDYWSSPAKSVRKNGSPVEGSDPGGVVRREGKRTYANLPSEAKAACDRFAGKDGKGGTIPNYTREMYLNDYEWPEGE